MWDLHQRGTTPVHVRCSVAVTHFVLCDLKVSYKLIPDKRSTAPSKLQIAIGSLVQDLRRVAFLDSVFFRDTPSTIGRSRPPRPYAKESSGIGWALQAGCWLCNRRAEVMACDSDNGAGIVVHVAEAVSAGR